MLTRVLLLLTILAAVAIAQANATMGVHRAIWFEASGAAAPPPTRTITFYSADSSTANSITLPSGINTGDLGILADCAYNNNSTLPTSVYPTGWTAIGSSVTGSSGTHRLRFNLSFKVLSSSDSSTSVVGMNGVTETGKSLQTMRKSAGTWGTPASVTASVNAAFAGVGSISVTSGSGTAPLFTLGLQTFGVTAIGQTPIGIKHFSGQQSSNYFIYASSPPDTVMVPDSSNAGCAAGMYVQLGP